MFDLSVYTTKTQTMKKILSFVSHGYVHWTAGSVEVTKVLALIEKFDQRYALNLNENQRAYRKAKGLANARMLVFPINGTDKFMWWLLVTDGGGLVCELENLKDTRKTKERLRWMSEFEVVKRTRKGEKKSMFTWRMTAQQYKSYKWRFDKAAASINESAIKGVEESLYRMPGFGEVRSQVGKLMQYAKKRWRKNHDSPLPPSGKHLSYVTYTEQKTYPVSNLLNRIRLGKTCFPEYKLKLLHEVRLKKK